jgi:hypothetical protein
MASLAAVLSVTQLAKLANISRQRMHRLLKDANVPMRRIGRKRAIFLTDLQLALPGLWESIREYRRLMQ